MSEDSPQSQHSPDRAQKPHGSIGGPSASGGANPRSCVTCRRRKVGSPCTCNMVPIYMAHGTLHITHYTAHILMFRSRAGQMRQETAMLELRPRQDRMRLPRSGSRAAQEQEAAGCRAARAAEAPRGRSIEPECAGRGTRTRGGREGATQQHQRTRPVSFRQRHREAGREGEPQCRSGRQRRGAGESLWPAGCGEGPEPLHQQQLLGESEQRGALILVPLA